MLTAFNRALGTKQGRIKPANAAPFSGEYVFCLGHDDPGHVDDVSPGDFALAEQHALIAPSTKLIRIRAAVRPPAAAPTGFKWVLELLVDDKLTASCDLPEGGKTRQRELAANVSKLDHSKKHFVSARLRFVSTGSAQFISLASFEVGPPEEQDVGFPAYPGNISSGATFGTTRMQRLLYMTGIAGAGAFGTLRPFNRSIPGIAGIGSAVAIGDALLMKTQFARPSGLSSAEALGAHTLTKRLQIATPSGVGSAYVSGTAKASLAAKPSGLSSAEAFGTLQAIKKLQFVTGSGISSAQSAGSPTLTKSFNPSTLSLKGWWRGYTANTSWVHTSGTANLSQGGAAYPTQGALNSYSTAVFNGSTQALQDNGGGGEIISSAAYTIVMLVKTPASASAPATNPYDDASLIGSNGNRYGISFTTSGCRAWHFDGTVWKKTSSIACSTDAYHVVAMTYDGTNISIQVDNGSAQTVAASAASLAGLTPHLYIGRNGNGLFGAYTVVELMMHDSALSALTLDAIYTDYFKPRYPSAGLP